MNVGLYRGAMAMAAQQRRIETIATNLANVGTTAYKRGVTAAHELVFPGSGGERRGLVTHASVDFAQGVLVRTGRDLDLALFGEGFFAIEGPRGEVYTRNGSFQLTPEGVLVNEDGYQVAWERRSGAIDPTGQPLVVDGEGGVRQGQGDLGRLRVVDFADPGRLRQDGGGYWVAPPALRERAHGADVHQGALEESNANGVEELVAMIVAQRAYDASARVISKIDESYARLTRPF